MIYRIDVGACPDLHRSGQAADPHGRSVRQQIASLGHDVGRVDSWRIFYIDTTAPREQIEKLCRELLADPIVEHAVIVTAAPPLADANGGGSWVEIHLKPGVMDPVADSTEMAIRDFGIAVKQVRTGRAYRFEKALPKDQLRQIASRVLANEVVESIHLEAVPADEFPRVHDYKLKLRHVAIRNLSDDDLKKLSREGHLFLSVDEMKAVQQYFRRAEREPTDIELETLAQTWSEHCVHKTLKSAVEVCDESGNVLRRYGNLIKETIFKATAELMQGSGFRGQDSGTSPDPRTLNPEPFCLSVFKDNAGVIVFDEVDAVCFKVETHNHPSAIEPYGGAATGAGGVIRDILGTGLAAKPIANTDVFCVAFPGAIADSRERIADSGEHSAISNGLSAIGSPLPKGVIHPKRVLRQIVAGVRDYGNRMGIPTINGAVYFDDRYIGNPLVFCGCVGLLPREKIEKQSQRGDAIVVVGGRTGRDGIHGATFSSAELTDTHADEFSHAVQIGNAITEKKVADVILQARDRGLFSAITDCGAGGLSSAVGEMGAEIGATVELERVPLKYAGLRYDEIWISEAQERMVLAVPQSQVAALLKLSAGEDVEATVIGTFGTENNELLLNYAGTEVGRMSMAFLHDGIPMPTRRAIVNSGTGFQPVMNFTPTTGDLKSRLLGLLAHPNIASKHWIIRQYDHEVQAGSVIKPLIGPLQRGPSDASVIRPKLNSYKGVVIACGLAPYIEDPYAMAIAAIDEAIRNAVAVGADPRKLAMLDNFCWPSVDDERTLGTLVRTCEACYDAAKAYSVPFISGKDSLHNQFTDTETGKVTRIPNTLLISTIGVIDDVRKCITMDLKQPGNSLWLIKSKTTELHSLATVHRVLAGAIAQGLVRACHDVSDGGILTAAAEMCIAADLGLGLLDYQPHDTDWLFNEMPGAYLVELPRESFAESRAALQHDGVELIALGEVAEAPTLRISTRDAVVAEVPVRDLAAAFLGTLDW